MRIAGATRTVPHGTERAARGLHSFAASASAFSSTCTGYGALLARDRRRRRMRIALQAAIAVLSIAAAWLVSTTDPQLRGWGFVLGLASQPLWFIETWRSRQWGMLLTSVFYTGAWMNGVRNFFL